MINTSIVFDARLGHLETAKLWDHSLDSHIKHVAIDCFATGCRAILALSHAIATLQDIKTNLVFSGCT